MTEHRFESKNDPPTSEFSLENQRRLLELELIQIRNEALAARLDARAAEVELMIQKLRSPKQSQGITSNGRSISSPHFGSHSPVRFASWDDVRQAVSVARLPNQTAAGTDVVTADLPATPKSGGESVVTIEVDAAELPITRMDAAHSTLRPPRFLELDQEQPAPRALLSEQVSAALTIDPNTAEDDSQSRQRRPAAWLISAVAHVAILLILAAVGIQTQRPKDQLALAGSVAEVNEVSMETFEMESSEPVTEPTETEPSAVEYELSPVGEMEVTKITIESAPAPPTPAAASMSSSSSAAAALSLKSVSDSKIQFCGVEGGGNHFVYMVDCSKSMGDAFVSARNELLASIEALTAKQRFYVIFYDKDPDYMRLGSGQQDEQRSAYATAENKAALRRWAMQIKMDSGWAPYDPMRFALNLKPDVIFLLSDGEFPQKFEDLVKAENKVANLFGDSSPISIVHTISYYSEAGESRMRRIAEQNNGQYRHVPKP